MPDNDVSELTAKEWLFHSDKVHIKDLGPKSYIPLTKLSPAEIELTEGSLKALGIAFKLDRYQNIPAIMINEAAMVERFRSVDLPTKMGRPAAGMGGYIDDVRDVAAIARETKFAAAGSKFAKINLVFAAAATVTSVALTDNAHAQQRDIATTLNERGILSGEALREYRTLSKDVQFLKNADTIVNQTAIGAPIGLILTEQDAAQKFQAFSNKYRLPQEIHVMLGMSIFDGLSLRGKLAKDAEGFIDSHPKAVPPELQSLWRARQAVVAAKENYWDERSDAKVSNLPPQHRQEYIFAIRGKTPDQENAIRDQYFPALPVARDIIPKAEAAYQAEFEKIFSSRPATVALLSRLPHDSVLQIYTQMAIDSDSSNPNVQKFGKAFDEFAHSRDPNAHINAFVGALKDMEQSLKKDPQQAYNFIYDELGTPPSEPLIASGGPAAKPRT